MDLLTQLQQFGSVKAGLPPTFVKSAPTTISVAGSVVSNAGVGGLILRAYAENAKLPNTASSLSEAFGGIPIATNLITTIDFNLATFAAQSSNYSLRISGYIKAPLTATYIFRITTDDGARLYVDDNKLLESWTFVGGNAVPMSTTCHFVSGNYYSLLIEHIATGGSQILKLEWSTDGVNFSTLTHSSSTANFSMAYDAAESPGSRSGSLRMSGNALLSGRLAVQSPRKSLVIGAFPYIGTLSTAMSDLTGAIAIAFWGIFSQNSGTQTIFSIGGNRHIQLNSFNQIVLSPSNGISYSDTEIALGVPNHFVIVLNSTNQYGLFVNGALDNSYSGAYAAGPIATLSSNKLAFGGTSEASPTSFLNSNSVIADFSIWKLPSGNLTTSDILTLYNSGARSHVANLTATNLNLSNLYCSYPFDADLGTSQFTDNGVSSRHLQVTQTVKTAQAIIRNADSLSVDSFSQTNYSLNNLGIGTPTPVAPLTVAGTFNSAYGGALISVRGLSIGTTSHAAISISTGLNSTLTAGNAFISFDANGVGGWTAGQDVNDGRKFKIISNNSFITSTVPAITIDSSNRVGVKTSSPAFTLDVAGDINFTGSLFQNNSQYISSQWTTSGQNLYFFPNPAGNVGINTSNPTWNLDVLGSGRFSSSLTTATITTNVLTANNLITTKLGIGVSTIGQPLDVKGTSSWGQSRIIPSTDSNESAVSFYRYSNLTQTSAGDIWILGQRTAGVSSGNFGIGCYAPSGTVTALALSSTGNVGIGGITSPSYSLDVIGNINLTGTLYQSGSQALSLSTVSCSSLSSSFASITNGYVSTLSTSSLTITNTLTSLYGFFYQNPLPNTVGSTQEILSVGAATANQTYLKFVMQRASTGSSWATAQFRLLYLANATTMTYQDFNVGGNSGAMAWGSGGTEYMRLINGNLGIGNSNPLWALDVTGSARVTGSISVGSISSSSLFSSIGSFTALTSFSLSASTLTFGSLSGTFASLTNITTSTLTTASLSGTFLYASTVTVSSLSCNLSNLGTLTSSSLSGILGSISSLTSTSLSAAMGNLGSMSFGSYLGVATTNPSWNLDVSGSARITGSLSVATLSVTSNITSFNTLTIGSVLSTYSSSTIFYASTITTGSLNVGFASLSTLYAATQSVGSVIASYGSVATLYAATLSYGVGGGIGQNNGSQSTLYCSTVTFGNAIGTIASISSTGYMATLTFGSSAGSFGSISNITFTGTLQALSASVTGTIMSQGLVIPKVQAGSTTYLTASPGNGTFTVSFPISFISTPIVTCTAYNNAYNHCISLLSVSPSGFSAWSGGNVNGGNIGAADPGVSFNWIAVSSG